MRLRSRDRIPRGHCECHKRRKVSLTCTRISLHFAFIRKFSFKHREIAMTCRFYDIAASEREHCGLIIFQFICFDRGQARDSNESDDCCRNDFAVASVGVDDGEAWTLNHVVQTIKWPLLLSGEYVKQKALLELTVLRLYCRRDKDLGDKGWWKVFGDVNSVF